jgi:hypothetical protein
MNLDMTRVGVWAADIEDKPRALARLLGAIADHGGNLDCVIARRQPNKAGRGVVFVSPLSGRELVDNADQLGLQRVMETATLKIEGPNEPGAGSKLAKVVADTGINLHGLSAMTVGHRFVCYLGFDNSSDLEKAEAALKSLKTHDWKFWRHADTPKETAVEHR